MNAAAAITHSHNGIESMARSRQEVDERVFNFFVCFYMWRDTE
jgi:hypothetical protein